MASAAPRRRLAERFPALGRLRGAGRVKRRLRFIPQTTATDCGAACLATVLDSHGKRVALRDVRSAAGVGRDGATAEGLLRAADWFGLRGRGVHLDDPKDLRRYPRSFEEDLARCRAAGVDAVFAPFALGSICRVA